MTSPSDPAEQLVDRVREVQEATRARLTAKHGPRVASTVLLAVSLMSSLRAFGEFEDESPHGRVVLNIVDKTGQLAILASGIDPRSPEMAVLLETIQTELENHINLVDREAQNFFKEVLKRGGQ